MRKFFAIIFLAAVAVSQYAKHISYLECRLTNYFSVESEKCDCEKILVNAGGQSDNSTGIPSHRHFHFDDTLFCYRLHEERKGFEILTLSPFYTYDDLIAKGTEPDLFRPPSFS